MLASKSRETEAFLRDIFSFVLPSHVQASVGLRPDDAIARMIRSPLSEPQTFALACYLEAAGIVDPDAAPRAARLMDYTALRPEQKATIRSEIGRALRQGKPRADDMLADPPKHLVDAINSLVIAQFAGKHKVVQLRGLEGSDFKHPLEASSYAVLSHIPGVSMAIAKVVDLVKRGDEIVIKADGIVVNQRSQPSLHSCYMNVLDVLGQSNRPPLYMHGTGFQLKLMGVDSPAITIPSMVTTFFDLPELSFLLGREIGHILAEHVRYRACAQYALGTTDAISSISLGLLKIPMELFLNTKFYAWMRASELTADRCGLLACQDMEAVLRALMKLSGYPMRYAAEINTTALLEQADAYQAHITESSVDRQLAWLEGMGRDNNYVVVRAAELLKWVRGGQFNSILQSKQVGVA